ncbi:MAG: zinc-ribbon domain-containing protein [Oscillospiraceae bacterium]|nr:zinc-ribbon domain-containing protein [Oscillospiraceae bacterium]
MAEHMEKKTLESEYPEVAKEWHPSKNGDLSPKDVTPKSGRKVWWLGKCGHEWQATISHRTDGQNCPICSNHQLLTGFNDLATRFPRLSEEWHPNKNGPLTPGDVFPMSNRKVWWRCKKGHEWQVAISCRTKGNNGCPICSGYVIQPRINDLLTINPVLAAQWDYERNNISPTTVSPNTHKKVWWICPECGNRWKADIHHRNSGVGCPACATKKAHSKINQNALASKASLAVQYPALSLEWNFEKNGTLLPTDVLPYSNKKAWWRCKKGHEWEAVISSRTNGAGCPYCDIERKSSFPEQAIFYYFSKIFDAKSRCKIEGKELDIFIPSKNVGIEYDGKYYHHSDDSKDKDLKKTRFFVERGIRVIRVIEGQLNLVDNDVVTYKHDAKYSELPWAINAVGQLMGLSDLIDVNLNRDQFLIFEQYIQLEKENSLEVRYPSIAKQWHPAKNGTLMPSQVSFGSQKRVWWLGECGHEWQSTISSRTYGHSGCPVCSGKLIVSGINDLLSKVPELAVEWDYEKNAGLVPSSISPFSHKKVWWTCSKCKHSWQAVIKNRFYGAHCPACSKENRKKHD